MPSEELFVIVVRVPEMVVMDDRVTDHHTIPKQSGNVVECSIKQ